MSIDVGLCQRPDSCGFVPLAALGYCLSHSDFFAPLAQVQLPMKTIDHSPQQKLQDVVASILTGCQSIAQINTKLRPEQALAHAWQRSAFASQSGISDTLDAFSPETVGQLRGALTTLYSTHGKAPSHDFAAALLWLDIDLTGLLFSKAAEDSTKGYFAGKKTAMDAKSVEFGPQPITKPCSRCSIRATWPVEMAFCLRF